MRCFTHPLLRRLLGLSAQSVPGGLSQSKGPICSPKWSSLRQSCTARPGLVTATDAVNYWQKVFEINGIPEARESSEYIVSFVLGAKTFQSLNSKSLYTPLTALQQEQIQQLSNKRLERMPVQYVLGEWDFQDLTLKMRPPVFIPRPETEDLVSLVVEEESWKCEKNSDLRFPVSVPHPVILEIGCGSGAIALSLLCKLPQSQVIAVDKEKTAVDLTRENAHRVFKVFHGNYSYLSLQTLETQGSRLQLQDRIHILHHDVSHSSAKQLLLWGPLDFIVSNPPYVFHEDMASLDAEILCYENLDALDGGDDGMRVIKTILALAPSLLKDSGSVFLEVDHRHPDMVENWLRAHPNLLLVLRAIHKDFCGKPRFLHIQKQSR
ncbi:HemK methyltransferase family member 1, transcript variant X1 [Columba livia]|uniref:HemK methyltransferase family member 1, transcript variant X1 n=1 Tax=Columba livia TaxID=8932 RepID=A0A2I0LRA2_COLLI|nr:hemK methyltransferase family member 1 isoform X1 [Columba livia]XP_021156669.1 hemK methyltransferase family member 1 isoform X1 [Columba livia]XP_021156671.1 hemK methyltransferase family member 1 isoform X1 [Columba livia]PKK19956.1 HemK methyltransferase family member 1, transcript variant X1 [Columba livia]